LPLAFPKEVQIRLSVDVLRRRQCSPMSHRGSPPRPVPGQRPSVVFGSAQTRQAATPADRKDSRGQQVPRPRAYSNSKVIGHGDYLRGLVAVPPVRRHSGKRQKKKTGRAALLGAVTEGGHPARLFVPVDGERRHVRRGRRVGFRVGAGANYCVDLRSSPCFV
jgi:hypothetical protein